MLPCKTLKAHYKSLASISHPYLDQEVVKFPPEKMIVSPILPVNLTLYLQEHFKSTRKKYGVNIYLYLYLSISFYISIYLQGKRREKWGSRNTERYIGQSFLGIMKSITLRVYIFKKLRKLQ